MNFQENKAGIWCWLNYFNVFQLLVERGGSRGNSCFILTSLCIIVTVNLTHHWIWNDKDVPELHFKFLTICSYTYSIFNKWTFCRHTRGQKRGKPWQSLFEEPLSLHAVNNLFKMCVINCSKPWLSIWTTISHLVSIKLTYWAICGWWIY